MHIMSQHDMSCCSLAGSLPVLGATGTAIGSLRVRVQLLQGRQLQAPQQATVLLLLQKPLPQVG